MPSRSAKSSMGQVASTRKVPSPVSRMGSSAWSCSSQISPTISSSTSSTVTIPEVPPNSSTTMAIWTRSRCRSFSRSRMCRVSGTKSVLRDWASRVNQSGGQAGRGGACNRSRSFTLTIPTMVSRLPR